MKALALISAPWPLFNRPSIQLGTLKAWLNLRFPDLTVLDHHFYLEIAAAIGYDRYRALSGRTWLAETVYGALLNPDRFGDIEQLFRNEAKAALKDTNFKTLTVQVENTTQKFLDRIDWSRFGLVGVSASLCQLTSTLYIVRGIKQRFPKAIVVVGGSTLSASGSRGFFEAFPDIDILIRGEGEQPLARLVDHLQASGTLADLPHIPGVLTRAHPEEDHDALFCQMADLSELPVPDYDAYFRLIGQLPPARQFFPTLPMEISRGCWWRKARKNGQPGGCAFCNLNLQWNGYRAKTLDQAVDQVRRLTQEHQLLSVSFMDNALPPGHSDAIFDKMGRMVLDLDLFGEIRATTSRQTLQKLANAGTKEVQIGIEALSTSMLKKLNKGTSAIQNLEIMKWCEELGIKSNSNLMAQFPGSDEADVAETLRVMGFARNFQPLRFVRFWLGMGGYVWQNPREYGVSAVFNHPHYQVLLGDRICGLVRFMIQSYRGDKVRQRKLWQPVKAGLAEWKAHYEALHSRPWAGPILSYRDGGDFLIIRQRRIDGEPLTHRLTGPSRAIYLFCLENQSIRRVAQTFPHIPVERISSFVDMMVNKGLMFQEGDLYLSLAVHHIK